MSRLRRVPEQAESKRKASDPTAVQPEHTKTGNLLPQYESSPRPATLTDEELKELSLTSL